MRNKRTAAMALLAAFSMTALPISLGCGSAESRVAVHPVKGSVSVNGALTENVRLAFYPQSAANLKHQVFPRTVSTAGGAFELSTYEPADGIPEGEYVVTASWKGQLTTDPSEMHPDERSLVEEKLDKRFTDPELSPLKVTVQPRANDLPPFELRLAETTNRQKRK